MGFAQAWGMPGPRNKPKNKKKKGNKAQLAPPPKSTTNAEPSPPPQPKSNHPDESISSPVVDPGTGPRVRDLYAFLKSPFAAPPSIDDPLCDWFFDSTAYAIIEQLLPQEPSLILHYNRTRLVDRICPACRRFYRLGDLLPFLTPEPGSIDELDRQQEDSRALREQQISGLCSFVCFSLACFNYPGARGAWGRTAELLDPWTTDLLNGPGAGIPDHGMSDLVKMTRNHDLGIGYMITKPWPGAPVLYEFDEDVVEGDPIVEDDEDELWEEESPYSSDSEPRGRERCVKPLGASQRYV
ncbi:F-box-like domain protein [Rhizoctonia solani 123E]|uniref:F-box-like domain protein n=1 Tax=Rhizoctonia solani 123E TaxID=1423351 RepID=A0A074SBR2_9AGAM|nr:F-box-like domain protein [Rhizoctonia solani 123E]